MEGDITKAGIIWRCARVYVCEVTCVHACGDQKILFRFNPQGPPTLFIFERISLTEP